MMFHLDEARKLRGFWKLLREFNVSRDLVIGHKLLFLAVATRPKRPSYYPVSKGSFIY
jgi:hypothetical protein